MLGAFSLMHASSHERWAATAAAGFAGVSVWWHEIQAYRAEGHPADQIGRELAEHGLVPDALEMISLGEPAPGDDFARTAADMTEAAAAVGCPSIVVAALGRDVPFHAVTERYAIVCDAAAAVGLSCAVEAVPFISSIETLGDAKRLVAAVERPNAGIVVDAMHFYRGGAPWDELSTLTADQVLAVQLDDIPLTPVTDNYVLETMHHRLAPGEGELDLARFVATFEAIPLAVPYGVEVASEALNAMSPVDAAKSLADATRAFLAGLPTASPG